MNNPLSILDRWGITVEDLTNLVDENPSLRDMLLGYVAEKKFHDTYLSHSDIAEAIKDDDHDRKLKGDRRVIYRGHRFIFEVKSLQTKTVRWTEDGVWTGKAQVDGSDRRVIRFPDNTTLDTTLLLRGEFDLLAVNFRLRWNLALCVRQEFRPSDLDLWQIHRCAESYAHRFSGAGDLAANSAFYRRSLHFA